MTDTTFSLDMSDMSKAAHALGISEEFLAYGLQRAEDYGATNDYVKDAIQGELKLQEITHDTAEAIAKKNELIAQGAPQEVIDEYTQKIEDLDQSAVNVRENIQDVVAREGKITKKEVNAAVDSIKELSKRAEEARKAGRYGEANEYAREAENVADKAGIKMNPDGTIDYAQLNKDYKGWNWRDQYKKVKQVTDEQVEGVELQKESIENNEEMQSGLDKIKKGWKDNKDQVQQYVDALQGADIDQLKGLDLDDGKYVDGLKTQEDALDSLAKMFGLTADEASALVPFLQEIGVLGQEETAYTRVGQGGTLGVETAHAEDYFKQTGSQYQGVTNFDAASMSAEQLLEKQSELQNAKISIDVETEGADQAIAEIDQLSEACRQEYNMKIGLEKMDEMGVTAEQFMRGGSDFQRSVMVKMGVNPADYDAFVSRVRSENIESKIKTYIEDHAEGEIQNITEQNYQAELGLTAEEASWGEVEAKIESIGDSVEPAGIKVEISQDSLSGINTAILAALNGQTYEAYVEANTEQAETEIAGLDGKDIITNVDANTEQLDNKIEGRERVLKVREEQIEPIGPLEATIKPNVETIPPQEADVNLSVSGVDEVPPQEGDVNLTVTSVDASSAPETTVDSIAKVTSVDASSAPEAKVTVTGVVSSIIQGAKNFVQTISSKFDDNGGAENKMGILRSTANSGATMTIKANTADLDSAVEAIRRIQNAAQSPISVNVDPGNSTAAIDNVTQAIEQLKTSASETPTLNVNVDNGLGACKDLVRAIDEVRAAAQKTIEIKTNADTSKVEALKSAIASVPISRTVQVRCNADSSKVEALRQAIINVPMHRTVSIAASVTGLDKIEALRQAIISIPAHRTVSVTASYSSTGTLSAPAVKPGRTTSSSSSSGGGKIHTDPGGKVGTTKAYGTFGYLGNGYAKGTIDKNGRVTKSGSAYNTINYMSAKASGDVSLKHSEDSLTNELGMESILRDGRWLLIPGGPHIEHLKRGDIIFNHKQTEDLLNHGRTRKHARIVGGQSAFAQGTTNGMRGFVNGNATTTTNKKQQVTITTDEVVVQTKGSTNSSYTPTEAGNAVGTGGGSNGSGSTGTGGGGGNTGTGTGSGNQSQQQPAAEPEKDQYSQDIFDYVELRLKYFADATKKIADKITDYVSDATKGRLLRKEIEAVQNEISANSAAVGSYSNFAEQIARSFAYTDKDGNKKVVDLTSSGSPINYNLLKQGYIGKDDLKIIETTKPDQAAYVEAARAYLDYIDKAREANNSVQDLTNTLADLYQQIIELPTDKLEKWLDKLENKINTVTGAQGAISSGMSGVRSAQRMLGFATDSTEQELNAMNKLSVATGTQLKRNTTYNAYKAQIDAQTKAGQDVLNSSAYKNATKAQKDAIKKAIQGEDVVKNVGGLGIQKGTALYDLLLKYNTNANKRWNGDVRKAYMAAVDADDKADAEAAKAEEAHKVSKQRASDVSQTIINDGSKRSFVYQNNYLDKELKLQKEELKKHRDAMVEVERTTAEFTVDQANTKSAMDKQKNVLLKDLKGKKGEAIIKDAVSKGKQINIEDVDDSLKNAVGEWNKLVITYGQLGDAITRAKDKEDEVREDLNQAAYETAEMEQKNAKQKFENIKAYYEAIADYNETRASVFAKQLDLVEEWEARGANARGRLTDGLIIDPATGIPTIKNDSGVELIKKYYDQQINEMEKNRGVLSEELAELEKEFSNQQKSGLLVKDSEEWMEAKNQIYDAKMAISDLEISIDKLYDKMLQDVYFKPIEKAIENLDKLRKSYESLEGLISQDMMYTEDGTFTDLGLAKYTMDVAEYKAAQDQLNELEKERLMAQRMYNPDPDAKQRETGIYNDVQYSTEEYTKKMEEIQEKERQTLSSMASTRKEIIKDVTDRYQTEITYINKLIDARKAEINKKKEMYEYDKKLKKQTKEVQLIEQQIRALNGLTDAESKAQKARLEAQRKELQEELDDTVRDHVTELRIEGLSELQEQLQKNYEKLVKDLAINVDDATKLVADSADNLSKTLELTNGALNQFIKSFNPDIWWASLLTDGGINYNRRSWNESDLDLMERPVQKSSQDAYDARDEYYAKHHYTNNLSAEENEYWKTMTSDSNKLVSDVGRIADALTDPYNTPRIGGTETKPYAKGTTHAKGGMSLVNDGPGNKPEMIVTKRGILIPLSPGDGVVPGDLTANLMQIAKSGALPLQMPEIKIPDINMGGQVLNSTADIHFDSLIRVDGNVDD